MPTSRTWRPKGGYQTVEPPARAPPCPPVWMVPGPIGVNGVCVPYCYPPPVCMPPPQPQALVAVTPAPARPSSSRVQAVPPPPPPASASKKDKKVAKDSDNNLVPPPLASGMNYMFPEASHHTIVHIFNRAVPVWKQKYNGQEQWVKPSGGTVMDYPLTKAVGSVFKTFKVPTFFTIKHVIEKVLRSDDEAKCKLWAATEVTDKGDGQWIKLKTIEWKSDKGSQPLHKLGWNHKRGRELPPVWLVVHKIESS